MNVKEMIDKKLATPSTQKSEKVRFMLEITEKSKADLEGLATTLGTGRIALASELFELALGQALEAVKVAKKA